MNDSTVCPLGHDFTSQFGVFHYMLNHYWFIHWTLKLPLLSHFGCVSFNGNHLFTHYSWYSSKLVLLKNMQSCRRFLWALCWMFFLWEFITFICFCMLLYAFRVLLKSTQVFRLMIFLKINKKHLKKFILNKMLMNVSMISVQIKSKTDSLRQQGKMGTVCINVSFSAVYFSANSLML